jgi:putative transposase
MPTYELFSSTEVLGRMAMERILSGLSARRYAVGLEPVGESVTKAATATSRSSPFPVRQDDQDRTGDLLAADLSELDLVAFMVDGCTSRSRAAWSRWGIDVDVVKHPLAMWRARRRTRPRSPSCASGCASGAWTSPSRSWRSWTRLRRRTEPSWTCSTTRSWPGAGCTRSATSETTYPNGCGAPGRAADASRIPARLRVGCPGAAQRAGPGPASAAASLREGLAETITVFALDVPRTLARTLRSTNAIESMIGICREHAKNVKHWQDGRMAMRWCAAGMIEAARHSAASTGTCTSPRYWGARTACCRAECQGPRVKMRTRTPPD